MRNDSAHVFINGSKLKEFKEEIKSLIEFFEGYFLN
jgi:hypothetical protein